MISIIIAIWVWTGIGSELPCEFIELPKSERRLLMEYIVESTTKSFFPNDKGLVMMTITQDSTGQKIWHLMIQIDDSYKDAPSDQYTMLRDYMILITDERIKKPLPDSLGSLNRIKCLEEIIGSRVYRRNDEKGGLSVGVDPAGNVIRDENGKFKMIRMRRRIWAGNLHNNLIIEFKKDGTIEKKIPV